MKLRPIKRSILLVLHMFAVLAMVSSAAAPADSPYREMTDSAGNQVSTHDASAIGGVAISPPGGGPSVEGRMRPPALLAREDYQKAYEHGMSLLKLAQDFRLQKLMLATVCTGQVLEDCLQNYRSFAEGRLLYRFCADYSDLNGSGSCRSWDELSEAEQRERIPDLTNEDPLCDRDDVCDDPDDTKNSYDLRNKLLSAREIFGHLALAEPQDVVIDQGLVRELGRTGVVAATREIANIHLIFGNQYMVDALDWRFGGQNPQAEAILREEIALLELSLRQFELAVAVMGHAFNADFGGPSGAYIGDYFGQEEYDLFGIVSERMVVALSEIALRYRQLGENQTALNRYAQAFQDQYVQMLALAYSAAENDADFLTNGGWRLINNLEQLAARAQAINEEIDPFGYTATYVPRHDFNAVLGLYKSYVDTAIAAEKEARDAQREFEVNRDTLIAQLGDLREKYGQQLTALCGSSSDDWATCTGGQMQQNFLAMVAAGHNIDLTYQQLTGIVHEIENEQARANGIIDIQLRNGEARKIDAYARGVLSAYRVSDAVVDSSTDEFYAGIEQRTTVKSSYPFFEHSLSMFAGYKHSNSTTHSVSKSFEPNQLEIGKLESLAAVREAAAEARITEIESRARVKQLLTNQAEQLIRIDLAVDEWNRLSAEHNHLVEQYHLLLNLRELAKDRFANSYLQNPAYRILRDDLTIFAANEFDKAAKLAYLLAKVAEYDRLEPPPGRDEVFKLRTTSQLESYVNAIMLFQQKVPPGTFNSYHYGISIARNVLGLTDEYLDPDGTLTPDQRAAMRFQRFQEFLRSHTQTDPGTGQILAVEFPFATSLFDDQLGFSNAIWNHRIAGKDLPRPDTIPGLGNLNGVTVNLDTRQFGPPEGPTVRLSHGGHATYRRQKADKSIDIVTYAPQELRLVGSHPSSIGTENAPETWATFIAGYSTVGPGQANSGLFNLSVAASNWRLRIDLTDPPNRGLDILQLEDIVIEMDTYAVAVQGREVEAQALSARLQEEYEQRMARFPARDSQ